jgi:recombination protein RecA
MLDWALRKGGIPRGCLIDLFGDEGLGKTTLTLSVMAERIRCKEYCAYIDIEHRINPDLVDLIIPDKNYFKIFQPKDGDAALLLLESIAKMGEFKMIGMDSMAALVPAELLEEDATDPIALTARKVTKSIKKILGPIYENGTIVFLINQMRANLSFFRGGKVSTSINALKFLASIRLQMSSEGMEREGDSPVGQKVVITVVKNSFATPYGKAPITIVFGKGIDKTRDLLECGKLVDIIVQNGGWFTYQDKDGDKVNEIRAHGEADLVRQLTPIMPRVMEKIHAAMQLYKGFHEPTV